MSCTIYYKGNLKDSTSLNDVFNIISIEANSLNAELIQTSSSRAINFRHGKSETLIFNLDKNKIDGFWKWNGTHIDEFYRVLDIFIKIKPFFKRLKIDDDQGIWHEYVAQKTSCKIELLPLPPEGVKLLERMKQNEINLPSEVEKLIMTKTRFCPFNRALLRIIVQDFIAIMEINNVDDFIPQDIILLTNNLNFAAYYGQKKTMSSFDFTFGRMLLVIWICYRFEYKKVGKISELSEEIRGLLTSEEAALYGIESIFLNRHTGGASNSKETEMRKFAKKYYKSGSLGEVMVIDKPERELEFLFSMMNYLGFKYVSLS